MGRINQAAEIAITQNNTLSQATHANARPKLAREYYFLLPKKNFKFFSNAKRKIKTPDTQPN